MEKGTIALIIMMIAGFTYTGLAGLEPTHYCEERMIKDNCLSLSSTNKTCYTEIGRRICYEGWKEIPFMIEEVKEYEVGRGDYLCSPSSCVKID